MNLIQRVMNAFTTGNKKIEPKRVQKRSYKAAETTNSNFNWTRSTETEDSAIHKSLVAIRSRSRDLARNNPIMKHFLQMLGQNVVGQNGFKLQVLAKDDKGMLDSIKNEAVGRAYKEWTKKENCDLYEKQSLTQICDTLIKTIAKDGECIVRLIKEKGSKKNPFGFKLQLLDPDRLDLTLTNIDLENGNTVIMGVEMTQFGVPVAYYLRRYSAKDSSHLSGIITTEHERVSTDDLLHLFLQENVEQTRGIPWAHAVMIYMHDLDEFNQACLTAAKVGAASTVFLERESGERTESIADYEEDGEYISELGFGQIRSVPAGFSMKSFSPDYPSDAYQIYTKRLLQAIAGGLGLSQVFLGNDTEDLNYSTARTIILEERNYWGKIQQFMIEHFMDRIYNEWLKQALLNKKIITKTEQVLSPVDIKSLKEHEFIGRKWAAVDEQKQENANLLAYQNMQKSRSQIANENGQDYRSILEQYKQDRELEKEILGKDFDYFNKTDFSNSQTNQNNTIEKPANDNLSN